METLETLFSSQPRVQILRTFLFQPQAKLSASDIAERAGVAASTARSHAQDLAEIKLLQEIENEDKADSATASWQLNSDSKLRDPLHEIVLMHQEITPADISKRLQKVGDVSLLILSGIFSGTDNRPVDVLITGDNIDPSKLSRSLTRIEKSFGTELRYTHFSKDEFNYRYNVYDRLIRDVLDYPHHVLVDQMNVT